MAALPASDSLRADHRAIESHLDRLLADLQKLTAGLVPEVRQTFAAIRRLAVVHFDKEEKVFYPYLRPVLPDVLARMDEHHEQIREVERHVIELLSAPEEPPSPRLLNDLRAFGIQFHDVLQHHIVDEEDQLFRLADQKLFPKEQQRLAAEMEAIERLSPAAKTPG